MHKFGGRWTDAKLSVLGDYLKAYTTALKKKGFRLLYVDAFAGSGSYIHASGDGKERKGSARIALEVPGFHGYAFIEKNHRRCESLRAVTRDHPIPVKVWEGDANQHIREICQTVNWRDTRAVLFLDPYGMQVEWATLEAVADTRSIDVWFLFPLSGITRQLALDESKLDADKRNSLDRALGTPTWREALYGEAPCGDLFGATSIERHADSVAIEGWVTKRLQTVFPLVEGPVVLRLGRGHKLGGGPPLFGLYFLAASPSRVAQKVAGDIARGVIKKLRREAGI